MKTAIIFSKAVPTLLTASFALLLMAGTSVAFAAGDVVKGKKLAKKCKACHTLKEGGKHRLGPNLWGILNKKAGAIEGYKYSKAMKASGLVWDEHTFTDFVTKPKKIVKGTKMSFAGFKKPSQRADLLAYFKTLGSESGEAQVTGSIEAGIKVAAKSCDVCHSFEKGGKVVYGPNLFDIYGKPAAAIEGYDYSDALKASGLVWNDKNLAEFVSNPEQFVKGTKARFPGIKTAKDKADILAYIKSLK